MFRAKFGKDGINVVRHYFQKVFTLSQADHHRPASDPIVARQCVLVEITLREKFHIVRALSTLREIGLTYFNFQLVLHKNISLSENY